MLSLVYAIIISLLAHAVIFVVVLLFLQPYLADILPRQGKGPIVLSQRYSEHDETSAETDVGQASQSNPRAMLETQAETTPVKQDKLIEKKLEKSDQAVPSGLPPKVSIEKQPGQQIQPGKPAANLATTEQLPADDFLNGSSEDPGLLDTGFADQAIGHAADMDRPNDINIENLEYNYQQELLEELAKYKKYPGSAKKRGLEGEVVVAFTVMEDGTISQTIIQKSSGWKILDRAALKSLERMGQFKPIPVELNRRAWEFLVTIHFSMK